MILYFNKNGQLLEQLEYGSSARVGTTTFSIFAYFEDLDDYSEYNTAMISFKKPDLQGSEYPDFFMVQNTLTYDPEVQGSDYFKTANNPYRGFKFDFNSVTSGGIIVKLLDTPGMWEASITLYKSEDSSYVTGLVRFLVEGAVYPEDDYYDPDINVIIGNIRNLLIDDYVPYRGANSNVDLGNHNLSVFEILVENIYYAGDLMISADDDLILHATDLTLNGDYVTINANNGMTVHADGEQIEFNSASFTWNGDEIATQRWVGNHIDEVLFDYVPYSGARTNVNLGNNNLSAKDVTATGDAYIKSIIATNRLTAVLDGGFYFDCGDDMKISGAQFDILSNTFTWNGENVATESYVDSKIADLGVVYRFKGDKTVAQLNSLTGQEAGDVYNVTDSGTLNAGGEEVVAGDNVAWTNNNQWDKLAGTVDLSPYAKTEDLPDAVLNNQATTTLITNPTTNANGWLLSNYESADVTITPDPNHPEITFDCVKITRGGNNLTEAQAIIYMEAMTGSKFLPKFSFEKPSMSLFVDKDGNAYKPQWDSTNGLLLYKLGSTGGSLDFEEYQVDLYFSDMDDQTQEGLWKIHSPKDVPFAKVKEAIDADKMVLMEITAPGIWEYNVKCYVSKMVVDYVDGYESFFDNIVSRYGFQYQPAYGGYFFIWFDDQFYGLKFASGGYVLDNHGSDILAALYNDSTKYIRYRFKIQK